MMVAGKVVHTDIAIGDSKIMMADEFLEWDFKSSATIGGTSVLIHPYIEDVKFTLSLV